METDYFELLYWSFFAVAALIAIITQTAKKILKPFLPKNKWIQILFDGRIIPALLGLIAGCIPTLPVPPMIDETPSVSAALYFLSAGILSIWVYSLLEKIFRDFLPQKIKNLLGVSENNSED